MSRWSRSDSATAERISLSSESSTSGQITNACLPVETSAGPLVGARALFAEKAPGDYRLAAGRHLVDHRHVDSPSRTRLSERGIGVALIVRT